MVDRVSDVGGYFADDDDMGKIHGVDFRVVN